MNLDRFGLLHDARRGLLKAQQQGGPSSRQPAASKEPGGSAAAAFERLFEAAVAAKKKKPGGSKPKTKVTAKPSKPAAKKPAKTKSKAKKASSPEEKREELKKKFGLIDFAEDITQMTLEKLREHFGYQSGTINKALFANNVIWQVYRQIRDGHPPAYFAKGGSIRCFWYIVKKVVQDHPRVFKVKKDLDSLFSKQLVQMIKLGLLSYKDLNIIDDRKGFRKIAPLYGNPHIILLGEKFSFLSKLIEVALQYGITVQCSKGMPSLVMADTMITRVATEFVKNCTLSQLTISVKGVEARRRTNIRQVELYPNLMSSQDVKAVRIEPFPAFLDSWHVGSKPFPDKLCSGGIFAGASRRLRPRQQL